MGKASRRGPRRILHKPSEVRGTADDGSPLTRIDLAIAAGVAAATEALYLKTLCPTIYTSGAGENATAVLTLGVPHPPGFPLFCLAGWAFTTLVPIGLPAWRVNLFAATCGAAAAAAMFLFLRLLHGPAARMACAVSALLLATSRTLWSQAVIAEVYSLNALLSILCLLAAIAWVRGGPLWPLGLAVGLGVAVHPLAVLFAPAWALVLTMRTQRPSGPESLRALGALAAGGALHLYGPLRSRRDPLLDWGNPETLEGFYAYLTAAQYRGRMFGVAPGQVWQNVIRAASQLATEMTPILLPLTLAGAFYLWRSRRRVLVGTLATAAITFVYAVNYDIPWEIEVYFIPVVVVLVVWTSEALRRLQGAMARASAAMLLLVLAPAVTHYETNDRSRNGIVEAYGRDILDSTPQGATLLAPETDATFALLYLIGGLGERRDLDVWVHTNEGVKPLARALDPSLPPRPIELLVAEARGPVFHCDLLPPMATRFPQRPHRLVYQFVSEHVAHAAPTTFADFALASYVDRDLDFAIDDRCRDILSRYLFARGDSHRAAGNPDLARRDYDAALARAPAEPATHLQLATRLEELGELDRAIEQVKTSLEMRADPLAANRLGRMLIGAGRLDEARRSLERAIELDPDLAIAHSNLGGVLGMTGDVPGAVRALEKAVTLEPSNTRALANLGQAYLLAGQRERALETWRRALVVDPKRADLADQVRKLERAE